jgi:hypothetical protein
MIIAGFTISALCEIQISESVNTTSLTLFGLFTSSTVCEMHFSSTTPIQLNLTFRNLIVCMCVCVCMWLH